jgi:nucleoside-diphosphate-sugar epimerase
VEFLQQHARPSSRRARERLGWEPTPFSVGLARTVRWLRELGEIAA